MTNSSSNGSVRTIQTSKSLSQRRTRTTRRPLRVAHLPLVLQSAKQLRQRNAGQRWVSMTKTAYGSTRTGIARWRGLSAPRVSLANACGTQVGQCTLATAVGHRRRQHLQLRLPRQSGLHLGSSPPYGVLRHMRSLVWATYSPKRSRRVPVLQQVMLAASRSHRVWYPSLARFSPCPSRHRLTLRAPLFYLFRDTFYWACHIPVVTHCFFCIPAGLEPMHHVDLRMSWIRRQ